MTSEPSDPTIQAPLGPDEGAKGVWLVSLAEIDAMCRKAARGAGYSWGMAEEAGRAARWLAAYAQPGPDALGALLTKIEGRIEDHAVLPGRSAWASRGKAICPIATGAALSDRAEQIAEGKDIVLPTVLQPILMVPFLCRAARDLGCCFGLATREVSLVATPEGPATRDWNLFLSASMDDLRLFAVDAADAPVQRHTDAAYPVDLDVWRTLDALAYRTYAPATAASRAAAGSGASQRDND